MIVGVDFETRSCADLKAVGAWAYSLHPSTDIYCAVLISGGRHINWAPGDPAPQFPLGVTFLAHNCSFEKALWQNVLSPRYGWPALPTAWEDTQAHAAAANLPITLEGLGTALGTNVQKDQEGYALMLRMCVDKPGGTNKHDTPENRARLLEYCAVDVRTMIECFAVMPKMSAVEMVVWQLDQIINARGVHIDRAFVRVLAEMAQQRSHDLAVLAAELAKLELTSSTTTPSLKSWLKDRGVVLPKAARVNVKGEKHSSDSINRRAVLDMVAAAGIDPLAKAMLENRLEASKAISLAKLNRVVALVDQRDNRLRNSLQFCAAHTGRWSSRGLQVHNLPRGGEGLTPAINAAVLAGDLPALVELSGRPLDALSASLRSIITAGPGKELIAADFSAIEARVLAWLAGQHDVLAVLADPRRDIYVEDAKAIKSASRQLGKVCRLALGYAMGPIKFADTAQTYGIALPLKEARRITLLWRKNNDAIVEMWKRAEDACTAAIQQPGVVFPVGAFLKVRVAEKCLMVRLPSGRVMRYWQPGLRTVNKKIQTVDEDGGIVEMEREGREITFFTSGPEGAMVTEATYGGRAVENWVQATARDLLAASLPRLEAAGYPVVIHVHDSAATEVPAGSGSVEEFCQIMATTPAWAPGLPMKAEGYRDVRFQG